MRQELCKALDETEHALFMSIPGSEIQSHLILARSQLVTALHIIVKEEMVSARKEAEGCDPA